MLYLFASNLRPRYEQDIRDMLAAPSGMLWHLRYLRQYVSPAAQADWGTLQGQSALIHFSLQQAAQYHEPAFLPVRVAHVHSTSVEGNFWFVQFTLEEYISLPEPTGSRSSWVRAYGQYLAEKSIDRPYSYWVSVGSDILHDESAPLDARSDATSLFERTATYLHATSSFEATCFARFLRMMTRTDQGSSEDISFDATTQSFHLRAGQTYDLQLLYAQPSELTKGTHYGIDVDSAVIYVVGRSEFEIASRYDRLIIRLHATVSEAHEVREALLTIEPKAQVAGPILRLPVKVRPSRGRALATTSGTVLALVALGSPAFISNSYLALKIVLLMAGALTTALLRLFGIGR